MVSPAVIDILLQVSGSEGSVAKIRQLEQAIGRLNKLFDKGIISAKNYEAALKRLNSRISSLTAPVKKLEGSTKKLGSIMKGMQGQLLGFSLSMMFAGMAIQRFFTSVARAGVDSFMKITAGVTPAGQAITALGGAFEYVKFAVGEAIGMALLPLLPTIMDIVETFVDWIDENQELVGQLVILGIVIGTVLMVVGMLGSFINGIWSGLKILKAIMGWFGIGGVGSFSGLLAAIVPLLPIIAAILVIIGLLAAAWYFNFNGMQDFVNDWMESFWIGMKSLFKNLLGIFDGFMQILEGLFTGDTDKIMKGILTIIKNNIAFMVKLGLWLYKQIIEIVYFIVTGIIRIAGTLHEFVIRLISSILRIVLTPFDEVLKGFAFLIREAAKFGLQFIDIFIEIGKGIVDALLTPIQGVVDAINGLIRNLKAAGLGGLLDMFGIQELPDLKAIANQGIDLLGAGSKEILKGMTNFELSADIVANAVDAFGRFVGEMAQSLADNITKGKEEWLESIGLGTNFEETLNGIDKAVNLFVDVAAAYVAGEQDLAKVIEESNKNFEENSKKYDEWMTNLGGTFGLATQKQDENTKSTDSNTTALNNFGTKMDEWSATYDRWLELDGVSETAGAAAGTTGTNQGTLNGDIIINFNEIESIADPVEREEAATKMLEAMELKFRQLGIMK